MMRAGVHWGLAVALSGAAATLVTPSFGALREVASWLVRPAVLPFAWRAVDAAQRRGDANELFARAQQVLDWLPGWTDGHMVFAYRFALDGGQASGDQAQRADAALRRLDIALSWLERARADAGPRRLPQLLQTMSFLPVLAQMQEPGLRELLRPRGGAAAIADGYLAQAEALTGSAAVHEQRLFFTPQLVAAMLDAGQQPLARKVLLTAIERSADVRNRELATEWRQRLEELVRWLDGDPTVDLAAVRADERFSVLLPYLR
ncbi:MAG: hypothetical protein H6838_12405 [Planctomycetes bacterium]|nr:hypothetical protein [Planctomycetota bacterium]MCB9886287.1 hypothetical protein [Planctomycetota bacterium]